MKRRISIIGNPVAGGGSAQKKIRTLVQTLERRGDMLEVFLTKAPGDARQWAHRIDPGVVTALVVAGGDGTLNEVINGLLEPSRVPLVVLPTGTANMLACDLGLPDQPEAVAAIIERGSVRRLDMGLVDDRRFLLVVSAGFDAMVAEEMSRRPKSPGGYCAYALPLLRVLFHYRAPELRIAVDSREGLKGSLVVVSNTRNYGGIFTLAEHARVDSGHLDICIFPNGAVHRLARYALAAFRGRVSKVAEVSYLTGKRIQLESEEPVAVEVDGDYFGTTPVFIQLHPASLPVLVPYS